MQNKQKSLDRRNFLKKSSLLALGTGSLLSFPLKTHATSYCLEDEINIIGPKEGFSPQIGTLVSMMNWMRNTILRPK